MTEFNETSTPDTSADSGAGDSGASPATAAPANAGGEGEGAPVSAPSFDRSSYDGSWKDYVATLSDESHKDLAARFTSPADLIDVAVKQRKEMSTRIKLPGKDATPEDIAAFNRAIGVPAKPEEYQVKVPDGYEIPETTSAVIEQFKLDGIEAGVPKAALERQIAKYLTLEAEAVAAQEAAVAEGRRIAEAELKKEYGRDLEMHTNAARDLLYKLDINGTEEWLGGLVEYNGVKVRQGDHPVLMKILAKLGLRGGEAQPGGLNLAITADDKASAREEINQIYRDNPAGSDGYKSPKVQKRLQELFERLDG